MANAQKEVRELIEAVEKAGFTVENTGRHNLVRDTQGRFVYALPSTPSDRRWRDNAITDMKRLGILDLDPKKEGQQPKANGQVTVRPEMAPLFAHLKKVLADMGHKPGERTGVIAAFVDHSFDVAKQKKLRPFKSMDSGENTVGEILKDHRPGVAQWVADLLEATIADIEAPSVSMTPVAEVAAPVVSSTRPASPERIERTTQILERLTAYKNKHGLTLYELAGLFIQRGEELGMRVNKSQDGGRNSLASALRGETTPENWVLDLWDRSLDLLEQEDEILSTIGVQIDETMDAIDKGIARIETQVAVSAEGYPLHLMVLDAIASAQMRREDDPMNDPEARLALALAVMKLEQR